MSTSGWRSSGRHRDGPDNASAFAHRSRREPGPCWERSPTCLPEQVRGESTDARTDLFSLGAVLYEAATGTRAFARESSAETIAAILKEEPPPIPSDAELDGIIRGCLVKDADHRTPNAAQVASALRNLQKRAGEAERASVPTADQAVSGPQPSGAHVRVPKNIPVGCRDSCAPCSSRSVSADTSGAFADALRLSRLSVH